MDLDVLGPEHMTALVHGDEARAALPVICQGAMQRARPVMDDWMGEPSEGSEASRSKPPHFGLGYWASWGWSEEMPENGWNGAWFDWKITVSQGGGVGVPEGRVFVMAGLSKPLGGHFHALDPAWRETLANGLPVGGDVAQFRRWTGKYERFQRVAYLHEVVRGDSLNAQGVSLGDWLLETFGALREHGPPL